MNATDILKVPENQPERIFPNSEEDSKNLFRTLVRKWHPDINKDPLSQQVVTHIKKLYDLVVEKIQSNTWALPNTIIFHGKDKKERTIKFLRKRSFELGDMYYGDTFVCYVVRKEEKDLYDNGIETIKNRLKAGDRSKDESLRDFFPSILDSFQTKKDENVLVVSKKSDMFLLQDIIDFYKGAMDPKHAAWVITRLHEIACYLRYLKLTHNAISPENIFICPKDHIAYILGDFWYSKNKDEKLIAIPGFAKNSAPSDMMKAEKADFRLDLNLIRQVGLNMLGDPSGVKILHDGKTPKCMVNYLRGSSKGEALNDYKYWVDTVLVESFGKRRFVEMEIKSSDIYTEF